MKELEKVPGIIIDEESLTSSVIIPIIGDEVLFEVRSNSLPDQPGDICFPGGIIEEGESPLEAGLREIEEELLIDRKQCKVLGMGPVFHAPSMTVYPFITRLNSYDGRFDEEVSQVFTVPIKFFMENPPERHYIEWERKLPEDFPYDKIAGGKNYKWRRQRQPEMFYYYKDKVVWGMTAKMVYYSLIKYGVKEFGLGG